MELGLTKAGMDMTKINVHALLDVPDSEHGDSNNDGDNQNNGDGDEYCRRIC